ncbi:MAG: amidinotransferase [Saprospiraceae bacterium]|nr:amidinotransferase [Saprospiraceae bacterium]
MKNKQCTDTIMMVRPSHFGFNSETAMNNAFQKNKGDIDPGEIQRLALAEFDGFVEKLRAAGVNIVLVADTEYPQKTDAVFPNNWITTHANGAIVTYPMQSKVRRKERREDVVEMLMKEYKFDRRYSLEQYESKELYLEGTGSMILDRVKKVVYACMSIRTDPTILDKFCALTGYERVVFVAKDRNGQLIYHTNVMLCLGRHFAVICLQSIKNEDEQKHVVDKLERSGRKIIDISFDQMEHFAGNVLEIRDLKGHSHVVMSDQAFGIFTESQKEALAEFGRILHAPLHTIESYGGGSARCMIAEIFTPAGQSEF